MLPPRLRTLAASSLAVLTLASSCARHHMQAPLADWPQPQLRDAGAATVPAARTPAVEPEAAGRVQIPNSPVAVETEASDIQLVSYSTETDVETAYEGQPEVVPAGAMNAPCAPGCEPTCEPTPRWPAAGPEFCAPGHTAFAAIALPSPEKYPDEYLCDGGDRGLPAHYEAGNRAGIETEDTIGEFVTHRGKQRMRPSSKVCVYAPRFGAVRSVMSPNEQINTFELENVTGDVKVAGVATDLGWDQRTKLDRVNGMAMRSRAGGLESDAPLAGLEQTTQLVERKRIQNANQDIGFLWTGHFDTEEAAFINEALAASHTWSREEMPIISAKIDAPQELVIEAKSNVITLIDDRPSDVPGDLRIVKLANAKAAQPGDEIEFSIRYDNLGVRELSEVRIIDNLTPRLAFVEDSAVSDRDAELDIRDNGEGSVMLVWELKEPLAGQQGGLIKFRCRVR